MLRPLGAEGEEEVNDVVSDGVKQFVELFDVLICKFKGKCVCPFCLKKICDSRFKAHVHRHDPNFDCFQQASVLLELAKNSVFFLNREISRFVDFLKNECNISVFSLQKENGVLVYSQVKESFFDDVPVSIPSTSIPPQGPAIVFSHPPIESTSITDKESSCKLISEALTRLKTPSWALCRLVKFVQFTNSPVSLELLSNCKLLNSFFSEAGMGPSAQRVYLRAISNLLQANSKNSDSIRAWHKSLRQETSALTSSNPKKLPSNLLTHSKFLNSLNNLEKVLQSDTDLKPTGLGNDWICVVNTVAYVVAQSFTHKITSSLTFELFLSDVDPTSKFVKFYPVLHRLSLLRLKIFRQSKYLFVNTKGKVMNTSYCKATLLRLGLV